MDIVRIFLGITLLVLGRRLFWFVVAAAGFLFGIEFARIAWFEQPQWVVFLIAFAAGLAGALLAIVAQRLAFGLVGWFAGSYLGLIAAGSFGVMEHAMAWVIAGGIIGAIVAVMATDWAIIIFTCLAGAGAVVSGLNLSAAISAFTFFVLAGSGIFVQKRFMSRGADGPG